MFITVAGACLAIATVVATAMQSGWRVFACVLSTGTALAMYVAYRTVGGTQGQVGRAIGVAGMGMCPDTHVQHGRKCTLSKSRVEYGGVVYAMDEDADRGVCLDTECKRRMGPIPDMKALDDAQIASVCKMFKNRPFSHLNVLDSRCAR